MAPFKKQAPADEIDAQFEAALAAVVQVIGPSDYQRREEFILRRVRAGRRRIPFGAGMWLACRGDVRDIARGATSPVQLLIDASDSNTARLLSGYASEVTSAWNANNGGGARVAPVQAAIRFWYNPGRSAKKFSHAAGSWIRRRERSGFPP